MVSQGNSFIHAYPYLYYDAVCVPFCVGVGCSNPQDVDVDVKLSAIGVLILRLVQGHSAPTRHISVPTGYILTPTRHIFINQLKHLAPHSTDFDTHLTNPRPQVDTFLQTIHPYPNSTYVDIFPPTRHIRPRVDTFQPPLKTFQSESDTFRPRPPSPI